MLGTHCGDDRIVQRAESAAHVPPEGEGSSAARCGKGSPRSVSALISRKTVNRTPHAASGAKPSHGRSGARLEHGLNDLMAAPRPTAATRHAVGLHTNRGTGAMSDPRARSALGQEPGKLASPGHLIQLVENNFQPVKQAGSPPSNSPAACGTFFNNSSEKGASPTSARLRERRREAVEGREGPASA